MHHPTPRTHPQGRAAERFGPALSADPSAAPALLERTLSKVVLEHLKHVERAAAALLVAPAKGKEAEAARARACVAVNDLCAARSYLVRGPRSSVQCPTASLACSLSAAPACLARLVMLTVCCDIHGKSGPPLCILS